MVDEFVVCRGARAPQSADRHAAHEVVRQRHENERPVLGNAHFLKHRRPDRVEVFASPIDQLSIVPEQGQVGSRRDQKVDGGDVGGSQEKAARLIDEVVDYVG